MRRCTPSELPHALGFVFPLVHIITQDEKKRSKCQQGGSVSKMLDTQD